jgi:hypothetical protein
VSGANRPLTTRGRLVFGGLFIAMGAFPMWLSVKDPGSVNGPWWLGFVAGGLFAAAGLAVATQETPVGRWVGPLAVGLIFAGFAAIGNWIAFGPGPRACSGGVSFLFFQGSAAAGEMECRVAFGFGAVLLDAILVGGALTGLAKLSGSEAWTRRTESVTKGLLGVVLSPLILLALLLSVFSALKEKLLGRKGA